MSRIIELHASNVKKLKAVSIDNPDPTCNVIGGQNAQGKTSLIDSIVMAIGGKTSIPDKPIRDGEEHAEIVLKTEDLIVTRKFTPSGSSLKVTNHEGLTHSKAQSKLDELIGRLTLDPLAFTRLDAKKQAQTLRDLLGIDTSELDEKRKSTFDTRTEVNRDIKKLEAQLGEMTLHEGVGEEEVSLTSLVEESKQISEKNQQITQCKDLLESLGRRMDGIAEQIAQLNKEAAAVGIKIDTERQRLEELGSFQSLDDVNQRIANSEDTNRKIRENQQYKQTNQTLDEHTKRADQLSEQLMQIDQTKAEMLAAAEYPIDGIGISDDGVFTYRGIPFDQASAAEQLKVSAAMGLALNPKLRVLLIRDGSLLDDESLAQLKQFAVDNDAQLWIERVGTGEEVSIVIEDGEIASATAVA